MRKAAIIMGSDSDLPVAEKVVSKLSQLSVPYEVHVISAHRTPELARTFARDAGKNGFGVIISIAGKAAHLGGVLASHTLLPVIGIPVSSSDFSGMDALLSTVQMPPGVPVASMAVGGAVNAAVFAAQILALGDAELAQRLDADRNDMRDKVIRKDKEIGERFNGN